MLVPVLRYPNSQNHTLKAWNAADELLIEYLPHHDGKNILLINDRFGFLAVHLAQFKCDVLVHLSSQQMAIQKNIANSNLSLPTFYEPLSNNLNSYDIILIQIPKSLQLFDFYLAYAHQHLSANGQVFAGFMTKHFSENILRFGSKYFEKITQSLAKKKARVITLQQKKEIIPPSFLTDINYNGFKISQYSSVFSKDHIDFATQFLLAHLDSTYTTATKMLDIGCGNGIIGYMARIHNKKVEIHHMDDSYFAISSAKINLLHDKDYFHWKSDLSDFENEYFDLIVTNPPFHFEHEQDISVAINLFRECKRILTSKGRLIIVANKHLNYKTHLINDYHVIEKASNEKFIIYECSLHF